MKLIYQNQKGRKDSNMGCGASKAAKPGKSAKHKKMKGGKDMGELYDHKIHSDSDHGEIGAGNQGDAGDHDAGHGDAGAHGDDGGYGGGGDDGGDCGGDGGGDGGGD